MVVLYVPHYYIVTHNRCALYEEDVHLDMQAQSSAALGVLAGGLNFQKHIDNLREMNRLYKEADKLEEEADFYDDFSYLGSSR